MELEVGMYIRTKWAIYKITKEMEYNDNTICIDNIKTLRDLHEITKASFNLIDLIEVGDYVNKHLVFDKSPDGIAVYIEGARHSAAHRPYVKHDISTVLTKEQFEANVYKL